MNLKRHLILIVQSWVWQRFRHLRILEATYFPRAGSANCFHRELVCLYYRCGYLIYLISEKCTIENFLKVKIESIIWFIKILAYEKLEGLKQNRKEKIFLQWIYQKSL